MQTETKTNFSGIINLLTNFYKNAKDEVPEDKAKTIFLNVIKDIYNNLGTVREANEFFKMLRDFDSIHKTDFLIIMMCHVITQ